MVQLCLLTYLWLKDAATQWKSHNSENPVAQPGPCFKIVHPFQIGADLRFMKGLKVVQKKGRECSDLIGSPMSSISCLNGHALPREALCRTSR